MILVGNGGIATEVAYEIEGCQVIWVVKHENISVPFLDPAASQFLLKCGLAKRKEAASRAPSTHDGGSGVEEGGGIGGKTAPLVRMLRYTLADRDSSVPDLKLVPAKWEEREMANKSMGSALGPDWSQGQRFTGIIEEDTLNRPLKVTPSINPFIISKCSLISIY